MPLPRCISGGFSTKDTRPLTLRRAAARVRLSPAWGQPHHQETVGAQGHEPSGQPRQVASDIPVDDLDRGTPRRAVQGFLQAARAHDYQRAAEYLDLRRCPRLRRRRSWDRSWPVT